MSNGNQPLCACGNPPIARVETTPLADPPADAYEPAFLCEECVVRAVRCATPRGQLLDILIHPRRQSYEPPAIISSEDAPTGVIATPTDPQPAIISSEDAPTGVIATPTDPQPAE